MWGTIRMEPAKSLEEKIKGLMEDLHATKVGTQTISVQEVEGKWGSPGEGGYAREDGIIWVEKEVEALVPDEEKREKALQELLKLSFEIFPYYVKAMQGDEAPLNDLIRKSSITYEILTYVITELPTHHTITKTEILPYFSQKIATLNCHKKYPQLDEEQQLKYSLVKLTLDLITRLSLKEAGTELVQGLKIIGEKDNFSHGAIWDLGQYIIDVICDMLPPEKVCQALLDSGLKSHHDPQSLRSKAVEILKKMKDEHGEQIFRSYKEAEAQGDCRRSSIAWDALEFSSHLYHHLTQASRFFGQSVYYTYFKPETITKLASIGKIETAEAVLAIAVRQHPHDPVCLEALKKYHKENDLFLSEIIESNLQFSKKHNCGPPEPYRIICAAREVLGKIKRLYFWMGKNI